jgi:hypothetical protein
MYYVSMLQKLHNQWEAIPVTFALLPIIVQLKISPPSLLSLAPDLDEYFGF